MRIGVLAARGGVIDGEMGGSRGGEKNGEENRSVHFDGVVGWSRSAGEDGGTEIQDGRSIWGADGSLLKGVRSGSGQV